MDKKTLWIAAVIIAVLAIGAGAWYGLSRTSTTSPNTSMDMSEQENTNTNQTAEATNKVSMQNLAFSPAAITVKKGTMVTWTNNDQIAHTVTETDGQAGPDSSTINPGETFTFTYAKTGTFHYHCSIHASMTGTVTVTE